MGSILKYRALIILAAGIFSLWLNISGCTTYDIKEGTSGGTYIPHPSYEILNNNVRFTERELSKKIGVQATNAELSATGTLNVWATFQNHTDYRQCIAARTIFLTQNRTIVDGPTSWNQIFLPPNGIESYTVFSIPEPQIRYYRIEVRECQ